MGTVKNEKEENVMHKELTLKFNEQVITVRTNEDGLYCLNDIYRASGSKDGKKIARFWLTATGEEIFTCSKTIQNGKIKETYTTKFGVYQYSAWISKEFNKAVFETFEAATEGRGEDAVDIATSVAIPQELLDTIKLYTEAIQAEIPVWDAKQDKQRGKRAYLTIWKHIVDKVCVNTSTSELKLSFGDVKSVRDYLESNNHITGLGAYLTTMKMVLPMLRNGLDYYLIKDLLVTQVKL